MKQIQKKLLSWSNSVSIFATPFDSVTTHEYRMQRAHEEIENLKNAYHGKNVSFTYRSEKIRGKFVTAVLGDYPGTYMVVLRISSSRICSGPCFVHLHGRRIGGLVVTGEGGLVGITAKAIAHPQGAVVRFPRALAHAA